MKIKVRINNLYARVFKGLILVQKLKKHMDDIALINKEQPDYIKYKNIYNPLFEIIKTENVTNIEYNQLKTIPKIKYDIKNRDYYNEFQNRLRVIRSKKYN